MRAVIDEISDRQRFSDYRLIRFSSDPTVDDSWFTSAETSIFDGANSLDIQSITRPDAANDVVICSHVPEHLKEDEQAIRELVLLSMRGFLVLTVPRADMGETTEDWGFADPPGICTSAATGANSMLASDR